MYLTKDEKNTECKEVENKNWSQEKSEKVLVSRQPKKYIDFKSKKKNSNLKKVENGRKRRKKIH